LVLNDRARKQAGANPQPSMTKHNEARLAPAKVTQPHDLSKAAVAVVDLPEECGVFNCQTYPLECP
jgi:hypothetical protein